MQTNINQIIKERRSIFPKEFNGNTVDENVLETLLENANFAPNHKSNYPWRFLVMQSESLYAFLDKAIEIYQSETAIEKISQAKIDKMQSFKQSVSHAIAIVAHKDEQDNTLFIEDVSATAAAVQNMYLSLSQFENVGGYWSTGLGTYSPQMHQHFNLSSNDLLMGFFIIGCVDTKRVDGARKNYKQFVTHL